MIWIHFYVTYNVLGVLYAIYGTRCGAELLIKHEEKLSALSRSEMQRYHFKRCRVTCTGGQLAFSLF